jgi:signal transduction histidine kinase
LALSSPEAGSDRAEAFELQIRLEIARDAHRLAHALHPSAVATLGVVKAVQQYCEEFAATHESVIEFTFDGIAVDTSPEADLCAYRVVQEGLLNAAKHSGGRQFGVRLWTTRRHVHLEVHDDGGGFDVQKARESSGLGLVSMEERVKLVAGELAIASTPQHGTTVHARVPLN